LNSKSKHEHPKKIPCLAGYSGFWRNGEKSLNYHYDSMAPGGPTAHVLQAPGSCILLENVSVAPLALRYFFPATDGDHFVDTKLRKGDTLDR